MQTMSGTRTLSGEPPRSTAYYYADLERLKRKNGAQDGPNLPGPNIPPPEDLTITRQQINELSEYVESNEVVNDGAVREVPPLRDRVRQWKAPLLPEYNTPERKVLEETYSTAGTFPMPEPKEKEPLLAELELVGRLPLTQLETTSGVRRSRSWYLCCPNVPDEEISRESSWRYSSLRPVTAAPLPGQNGLSLVATHSTGRDDATSLRAERDALARALAAERQRAATAARAHDARLAELHGVIAELVRRRAADKHARAIPEEEVSDECESTTQPAGELDNDADRSRTEQNDTSSMLSPAELPTPQEQKVEPTDLPDDTTDTSSHDFHLRVEQPAPAPVVQAEVQVAGDVTDNCDTSLNLSEPDRDSEICLSTARCCQHVRHTHAHAHTNTQTQTASADSCEREHGSPEGGRVYTASPGRCESRQAKLASRVRLRRTEESDSSNHLNNEEAWCSEAAERLAVEVCAQADLREALVSQLHDGGCGCGCVWRARCLRLQADCRVLTCALARATDTAHRLYCACAVQESCSVSLCVALKAADRALETYDVLLALAETHNLEGPERCAAELVARQVLGRLDAELTSAAIGEPLLSPGPWLQHDNHACSGAGWSEQQESRLRAHAARLKRDTVTLREHAEHTPQLFSYHDVEEEDLPKPVGHFSMAEMEAAVMMQEVLTAREVRATSAANNVVHAEEQQQQQQQQQHEHKSESSRRRARRRDRHWLDAHAQTNKHANTHAQASETDL